jgi:hypothetical protein
MYCPCVFANIPSRYVADTLVAHNTIHDATYSGICAGWGWGMESYVRNIHIVNNSLTKVMQRLADGGGVYVCQISSRLVPDGFYTQYKIKRGGARAFCMGFICIGTLHCCRLWENRGRQG